MSNLSYREELQDGVVMYIRDMLEGFALAFILAFIFREFVVEAYIIPTGSMAHGLQGTHVEHNCHVCDYQYRAGASIENAEDSDNEVVATVCPMCGFTEVLDKANDSSKSAFSGDRILVNKFSYLFNDPNRWDVIVFKNPMDSTQNYIKRLVGLPGEKVLVTNGDVYTKPLTNTNAVYQIQRKPEHKQLAMMQLVHDTQYRPKALDDLMWPQPWRMVGTYADTYHPPAEEGQPGAWKPTTEGFQYSIDGSSQEKVSIRYHHNMPEQNFWVIYNQIMGHIKQAEAAGRSEDVIRYREQLRTAFWPLPRLITDVYAYNTVIARNDIQSAAYSVFSLPVGDDIAEGSESDLGGQTLALDQDYVATFREVMQGEKPSSDLLVYRISQRLRSSWPGADTRGQYWVGDLAVEFDVQIEGEAGILGFDIVEAGVHYEGEIDVATGKLVLSINGGAEYFVSAGEDESTGFEGPIVEGQTTIQGKGEHTIRFSNFDNELRVWVDDELVELNHRATFVTERMLGPKWSEEDPGDLLPIGLHSTGLAMTLEDARVYRDVYYIASKNSLAIGGEYDVNFSEEGITSDLIMRYQRDIAQIDPIWLSPNRSSSSKYNHIKLHLSAFPAWNDSPLFADRNSLEFDVHEDEFFPMGDNSPQSADARSETWFRDMGKNTFNRKLFIGEALLIYWPHPHGAPVVDWPIIPNFQRIGVIR
tara:strand:- start:8066 stop:10168 length:2103 start_codon:yes stop_codon:yes gene_type:complete